MTSEEPPDGPPRPPFTRLDELLGLLRTHAPAPPLQLTREVVQTARFERGVRVAARTAAGFGEIVIEGLAVLLGLRRRR